MVGGTENPSEEQVPTGDTVRQVHENKQTLPTHWVWGHKSRTIPNFSHLWTSPGPRSISENMEMTMTRFPPYLEGLTLWMQCSYEKEMYMHTYQDTRKSEAGMLANISSDQ